MFGVYQRETRERIVLQRLIVIARLPHKLADRTEVGAYYEKLNFQLCKQYTLDPMTGLLLVYPSCLLHVVESSRDVLLSVLKDMQQSDGVLQEAAKVVFMAHQPQSRMFQQWSYKVLDADQEAELQRVEEEEEEEESTQALVCKVLTVLQRLGQHLEIFKAAPGSVLDQTPGLSVPQQVLEKLLTRDELLTPERHLQVYNSPLDVTLEFGKRRIIQDDNPLF